MKFPRAFGGALLLATVLGASLRAEMPPLLADAIKHDRDHEYHWAYTETVEVRNGKGEVHDSIVLRYDPSRPYAEQYVPVSVDGGEPPKSFIQECRQRGEDEARERQKKFEKGESDEPVEIELSDEKGIVAMEEAYLFEEDASSATFKVPIHAKEKHARFPFESVKVLVKVNKADHTLSRISLNVATPVRINLAARLKGADISGTFTQVDPAYPPQLTTAEIDANIKFLLGKSTARVLIKRTAFKRVKPYDDRFTVKTGPLRTLGF